MEPLKINLHAPSPRIPVDTKLADAISEKLEANAPAIVEGWIDWVQERVGTRTVNALPRQAIENHIPPVLVALAKFIRTPLQAVHAEILGHLQLHGQIRRDQGYELQELLAEFDGLSHLVGEAVAGWLESYSEPVSMRDAITLHSRISAGLRAIALVTVGTYQDAEQVNRRELARRLEEFARAVSHELRNPINAMNLGIEILRSAEVGDDAEKRAEHLDIMQSALSRTDALIQDIRVLALAEGAQSREKLRNVRLSIQTVFDELRSTASQEGVELQLGDDIPNVDAHGVLLELVLVNAVGNSIKFSDPDKEERYVRVDANLVAGDADSAFVEITVTDNGIGIAADLLPRVFQRHFRAAPERAEGTGLGLAISHQLVTECGGSIEVESTHGEGTTTTFRIRALEVAHDRPHAADQGHEVVLRRSVEELLDDHQQDAQETKGG